MFHLPSTNYADLAETRCKQRDMRQLTAPTYVLSHLGNIRLLQFNTNRTYLFSPTQAEAVTSNNTTSLFQDICRIRQKFWLNLHTGNTIRQVALGCICKPCPLSEFLFCCSPTLVSSLLYSLLFASPLLI